MSKPNLSSVYAGLQGARGRTQVHIQDARRIGTGFFKVVAAVSGMETEAQFGEALSAMTEGAASLVPGSTVRRGRIVAGMIRANACSKPLDPSEMRMVTACTASDASGRIWNVVNDGANKRVILENADDLEAMLADRMKSRGIVANPVEGRGVATASVVNGDAIRFVDLNDGSTHVGLAFESAGEMRVVMSDGKTRSVVPEAIMRSVPGRDVHPSLARLQSEVAGSNLTPDELETAIAYLGRAGILSDEMAARMRALSQTPVAGTV